MSVVATLKRRLHEEQFDPTFIGLFCNPFFIARKGILSAMRQNAEVIHGKVVDVGCGRKPYRSFFSFREYIGIDVNHGGHNHFGEDVDVYYDGVTIPFADNTFDSALCNQVLEHVFEPEAFVKEIYRVLKNDGVLLVTVPFAWDEHEQPYDYARYSSFGLKHLLEKNGFKVLHQQKTTADIRAIFQIFICYIYKKIAGRSYKRDLVLTALIMSPITICGYFAYYILPANKDFYLDNVIVAKKEL